MKSKRERFLWWNERLTANNPLTQIKKINEKLKFFYFNIFNSLNLLNERKRSKLRETTAKLQALSPIAILERGYSITRTIPEAIIVKEAKTVSLNQDLEVMLAKGILRCRVKGKSTNG